MEAPRKTPRFWIAVQPSIIRLYKVAGLVALSAILIGLVGFLVVNIFYFFDHTWIKPVVLKQNTPKVIEASNLLADAKLRKSQLDAEKLEIAAQLDEIDRTIKVDDAFLKDIGSAADAPKTPEQWLVHREAEKARLDKDNQVGRRTPLKARVDSLDLRTKDQEAVVQRLEQSPYLRASNHEVVLAFVPYQNERNLALQTKLYACSWGLVMCHVVGRVKGTIDGEVEEKHPHDETIQRGFMIEIELTTPSAKEEPVLFLGSKPLWLF